MTERDASNAAPRARRRVGRGADRGATQIQMGGKREMTLYGVEWRFVEGDARFEVHFDSGNSCGLDQRDLYVARPLPIERISLGAFAGPILLSAYRGDDRASRQDAYAAEIARVRSQHTPQRSEALTASERKRLRREEHGELERLERALTTAMRALPRDAFDPARLHAAAPWWEPEARFLRSFYLEEVNQNHMRNFGRKYATDTAYRAQVDAGATPWARRNALFERNLHALHSGMRGVDGGADGAVDEPSGVPPTSRSAPQRTRQTGEMEERLWRWVCRHAAAIAALPEFGDLQRLDSGEAPSPTEPDREILPAVQAWNAIAGVRTRFSCRGVSGTVRFADRRLLVPSYHEPLAYIAFAAMDAMVAAHVREVAPTFASIARLPDDPRPPAATIPGAMVHRYALGVIERLSSVDPDQNVAFRTDARLLAEAVHSRRKDLAGT
jgi:hypothetical protein